MQNEMAKLLRQCTAQLLPSVTYKLFSLQENRNKTADFKNTGRDAISLDNLLLIYCLQLCF